jgi:uncharacterized SAM-binding protein YcdF (DUF218 family)
VFYALSKIAFFLIQPSTVAALLIGAGVAMQSGERRRRAGRRWALAGLALLLAGGLLPLGNLLILPLEQRFAAVRPPNASDRIAGIIILGGFEDGWVSAGRPGLAVNESAERLTEGLRLARRLTDARVVFTGGTEAIIMPRLDAAAPVGEFLVDAGIDRGRIVLEAKSRNTGENATLSAAILKPVPGERWALVTSAYHMPRAVGIFRKAGFDVLACPTDYRTRGWGDAARLFASVPDGLKRLDLATKEWIGLVVYYATGRSAELWPSPEPRDLQR